MLAAVVASTWGITIHLVLVRRFNNQAAVLVYNCWAALLMGSNLLTWLPALLFMWWTPPNGVVYQVYLCALVTDLLASIGLVIFILIAWSWRFWPAPTGTDFIVVLGAGLDREQVPPVLAVRLDQAYKLWLANPRARLIVSGGIAHHSLISEAIAMSRYLQQCGVPSKQIIEEPTALNTWQNLHRSWQLIGQHWRRSRAPRVAVVTSSFHVLRAASYGRRLGYRLFWVSAPTPWRYFPLTVTRDYLGVLRDHRYLALLILITALVMAELLVLV